MLASYMRTSSFLSLTMKMSPDACMGPLLCRPLAGCI